MQMLSCKEIISIKSVLIIYTGITPAFSGKKLIFGLEEKKEHLGETNPVFLTGVRKTACMS